MSFSMYQVGRELKSSMSSIAGAYVNMISFVPPPQLALPCTTHTIHSVFRHMFQSPMRRMFKPARMHAPPGSPLPEGDG